MKKLFISILLFLAIIFYVGPAFADSVSVNFENPPYTTGVINGQDGWSSLGATGSGCALYDQKVDGSFGYSTFGAQSLRISDAVTSGCFGDQVFAKPLFNAVGEADSTAGSFSTGTLQRHFEMQFDIASTVPGSQQPGLHSSVSPDRGDGSRMSYLRFEDGTAGIDVFFVDVQGTSNPANFVETQIATGLNRAIPHTVKLTLDVLDGPSNDIVKVWIDGVLVQTGTSWENYYRYDPEASAEQSPRITKTVIFRSSGAAIPEDLGKGFLFDNFSSLSGPIPPVLVGPPTNKNQCKNNGWKIFNNPVFKNQGACVSYVERKDKIDEDNRDHHNDKEHKRDRDIPHENDHDNNLAGKATGEIIMGNPNQKMEFSAFDFGVSPKDKGEIEYWNYDYPGLLHYEAKVMCANVKPLTKEGWFMFQIPAGWPGLTGLYVVSYVKDGGTPGTNGDLYGHTVSSDLATAKSWCENGTAPVGMYPITGGNLVVHN